MRLDKLQAGKTFKNYKELCKELEIPVKGGKGKQYQLEDLKRYCKYKKEGHKFIIEEVYDKPKIKNNESFIRLIELLLLDLLAQKDDQRIITTKDQLLRQMNMINQNYIYGKKSIPKLAEYIDVNRAIVYDFFNTSDSSFRSTIERALKSLFDRRSIFYKRIIMIKRNNKFKHEIANTKEEEFIISCESKTLEEMGFDKVSEVISQGKWDLFKYRVNDLIKKNKEFNIEYYYLAYDITLNQTGILKSYNNILELILKDMKRNEYKNKLNKKVIERFLQNAKIRQEKAKINKSYNNNILENRKKDNYISDTEKLLYLLIKPDAEDILCFLDNETEKTEEISDEMLYILECLK